MHLYPKKILAPVFTKPQIVEKTGQKIGQKLVKNWSNGVYAEKFSTHQTLQLLQLRDFTKITQKS
jgi:hypothetical protein